MEMNLAFRPAGYELGENLFYSSSPYPWTAVVNAWHSEVANYLYPNGSTNAKTVGHYTQVTVSCCHGNRQRYLWDSSNDRIQ